MLRSTFAFLLFDSLFILPWNKGGPGAVIVSRDTRNDQPPTEGRQVKIEFGFSPCPNDTFMFWAWVHGLLSSEVELEPKLFDIQELNRFALEEARFPLTKVSMATYLDPEIQSRYRLLQSGAALGRGCGPLVVSSQAWSISDPRPIRLAIPGRNTTACKLAQMAMGAWVEEWVELRYDDIMPAVLAGAEVDAGVIIHESRFVYQEFGLSCALDLGQWWETQTGLPLPLGLMLARRDLDPGLVEDVQRLLAQSILQARETLTISDTDDRSRSLWRYLRENAIELEDRTLLSHIELYVNDFSVDLGSEGKAAIQAFEEMA
jgi:5,8-dihydroxy-2-naphthoate synthase